MQLQRHLQGTIVTCGGHLAAPQCDHEEIYCTKWIVKQLLVSIKCSTPAIALNRQSTPSYGMTILQWMRDCNKVV